MLTNYSWQYLNSYNSEIFHCVECTFYIQGFEQLALALKTECPEIFAFRIFEQLALVLKIECPEIFHCIEYSLYIQDV